MRREGIIKPGLAHRLLEHLAHGIGAHLVPARRYEKIWRRLVAQKRGPVIVEISLHGFDAKVVKRDDALFSTLAENLHLTLIEINAITVQTRSFRNTGTACVQELQQGLITHSSSPCKLIGCLISVRETDTQQLDHVIRSDDSRQASTASGALKSTSRVAFDNALNVQPLEETAQRRKMPIHRRPLIASAIKVSQIRT